MKSLNKTNPGLFWGLLSSAIIVVVAGFIAWLVLFLKAKKLRSKIVLEQIEKDKKDIGLKKILKESIELMWDLKEEFNSTIDDYAMEYLITTTIRNLYKTIWIEGKTNGYEIITLAKKTKAKIFIIKENIEDIKKFNNLIIKYKIPKTNIELINKKKVTDKFDLSLISEATEDFNKSFDNIWSNINKKGMVWITNCKKLNYSQKQLIRYLKLIGARFEHQKINKGFIIIVK
ncbi:MAG: hypothetical protein GY679_05250 [Mycoplasma sp.]|nr:hypothetical protein [Mycoplasma sp.]